MSTDYLQIRLRRNAMFATVQSCTNCDRRLAPSPKPGTGPIPCERMILTDLPGAIGGRDYLHIKLRQANLPPLTHWFLTSTVRCRKDLPEKYEIMACHGNLRAELAVVDPEWILLLGSHALTCVGVNTQITKAHGRPFIMNYGPFTGRKCFPTFHPAVAYKSDHNANLLTQDLSTLYGLMSGRVNLSSVETRVGRSGKLDLTVEA